ncbi:MAG: TM2 domain-containing protein [Pyrinomonadaceae bacterium]
MPNPNAQPLNPQQNYQYTQQALQGSDKKLVAGICGILLGGFGVHKFVLGYNNEGFILLGCEVLAIALTVISCGILSPLVFVPSLIGLIEGIIYLTKSDDEFVQTYIINKKPWF